MTYAYLFKYIIIGDTGNPRAAALMPRTGIQWSQIGLWGRGSFCGLGESVNSGRGRGSRGGARGSHSPAADDRTLVCARQGDSCTHGRLFQVWGSHVSSCSLQTSASSRSTTSQ